MPNNFINDLFGLSGQVAVVVGGTGVLGGALCDGLAQAGATVVVAGRDTDRGEARASAITSLGGKASFTAVDVSSLASIESLLASTLETYGKVDILVNCAGVNSATPYFEIPEDEWDRILSINLKSTHLGCQVFGRHMAESEAGGSILNIGSVSSDIPLSRVFAYSASKAAVISLTRNVARELAPSGVRVNALCPGFFPAEQNKKILDPGRIEDIMRRTPMSRFGDPEELIGAVLLLLSRKAGSFITGATIYVDGGFTSMSI